MVNFFPVVVTFLAATASGAPIKKRINQNIVTSMSRWQSACVDAGGSFGALCNAQAIKSFDTLLANQDPCAQQDAADDMIDVATKLQNANNGAKIAKMITFTLIFRQQPRNSPSGLSVKYCRKRPRNRKLVGYFNCQFAGVNPKIFAGANPNDSNDGIPVGPPETIPLGHDKPLDPPGSCPAHPTGPIPDGAELFDITQDPGVPSTSSSSTPSSGSRTSKLNAVPNTNSDTSPKPDSSTSGNFHLDNGKAAQRLNALFKTLKPDSPCTPGENACVGPDFAQCANGKLITTPCAATLQCFGLPLENKPGTSVACTTQSDAKARVARTGAQGGITGSGS